MSIIIIDEDAKRLLSIPEAIEAMRVAFRDLSDGRAVNPPRLRYTAGTPDPAREDAEVLGLFGTGMQAAPNCRAYVRCGRSSGCRCSARTLRTAPRS
jgi:ornithine cyclodeaminase/alanine dehydrogenase-like protein (mu-crystallin family)